MISDTVIISLRGIECCNCHAVFGMTADAKQRYERDHRSFKCPYCFTSQSYRGKSDLELAQEALERERKKNEDKNIQLRHLENSLIAEKGQKTKLKKKLERVQNGLCPDCNKSFKHLAKHMKSKHGCREDL
ncbi:MAG: hypothetical protein SH817_08445 [Leptospira sp.]|nr:hypothetical protein [Leptospira sp.]